MIASIIFCGCGKVWWIFLAFLALKHLPSLNICHLRSESLGHLEFDFAVMMCRRFSKNSPILFWLCKKNCFFGQFLILLNEYYFSYNQVLISGQLQQQILWTTVNRISGVMVSKLALSVLDCGFKPQLTIFKTTTEYQCPCSRLSMNTVLPNSQVLQCKCSHGNNCQSLNSDNHGDA
jgi:hypothetical protein